MIKDLGDKAFKYHIYIEYYNAALNFAKILRFEKTLNINELENFNVGI